MKMKSAIVMLTVFSLLLGITAFAAKEPGDVPAPTDLTATINPYDPGLPEVPASITFDWVDASGQAEKYSLDVCGVVLVDGTVGGVPTADIEVEWCASFGTSDWNPDAMSDPTITIPLEDLHDAIFLAIEDAIAAAGITEVTDVELAEMYAKVKGLDPHDKLDKKRQNNLFSEPLDLMPHPAP